MSSPQEEAYVFFERMGIALDKLSDEAMVLVKEQMHSWIKQGLELAISDSERARHKSKDN